MAGRRGKYYLTPARRAALKKAQAASARKRRRSHVVQGAKVAGKFAGTVAAGAALWHVNNYARHPMKLKNDYNSGKAWASHKFGSGPDPNAPGVGGTTMHGPIHRRPLRYYGSKTSRVGYVAGRRISTRQRSRMH